MVKWLRSVTLRKAGHNPSPYWQQLRFNTFLFRSGVVVLASQRNMAAIFVNLAGMRDSISGYKFFVPPERAQQMQRHYVLYRAAYNRSRAATTICCS